MKVATDKTPFENEGDITIFRFHIEDHGRIDSSDGMLAARSLYTGVVEL
jgi:hypothetical protein